MDKVPKLLVPVILAQGAWVAWRALKLPEAAGPRDGKIGTGPKLRLLIIGDSSAAGVGVEHQSDALLGQILADLSSQFEVHYQLIAKTGWRTQDGLRALAQARPCDVALTVFGVNDITKGTSAAEWKAGQAKLFDQVHDLCGAQQIIVTDLPPIGAFPLLPSLLRRIAGARAALFQEITDSLAASRSFVQPLSLDLPLDPSLMAKDGFHPGAPVYALWGKAAASAITAGPATSTKG